MFWSQLFSCPQNMDANLSLKKKKKNNLEADDYLISLTAELSSLSGLETFQRTFSMVTRGQHKSQDQTSSFLCAGRGNSLMWSDISCSEVSFRSSSTRSPWGTEQNQLSSSRTLSKDKLPQPGGMVFTLHCSVPPEHLHSETTARNLAFTGLCWKRQRQQAKEQMHQITSE